MVLKATKAMQELTAPMVLKAIKAIKVIKVIRALVAKMA